MGERWLLSEIVEFEALAAKGHTPADIARFTGRKINTIRSRLSHWRDSQGLRQPHQANNPALRSRFTDAAERVMLDTINGHGGFPVLNFLCEARPDLPASIWLDGQGRKWADGSAKKRSRAKPVAA
jgi:hypothetical protein